MADDWDIAMEDAKRQISQTGSAPDPRSASQVAIDQMKGIGESSGLSGLVRLLAHPKDTAGSALSGAAEHPLDTALGLGKGALMMAPNAIKGGGMAAGTAARNMAALIAPHSVDMAGPDQNASAAQGAGQFAAGVPVLAGLWEGGKAAVNAIPNADRAGATLGQIRTAAQNVPTNPTAANAVIARAQELTDAGHGPLSAGMRKYIAAQKPDALGNVAPINYPESFDFASAAKKLSSRERTAQTGMMSSQVKQFAGALQDENRAAATSIGMGDAFDSAMKEYRQAKGIESAVNIAKKYALKTALTGGLIYELTKGRQ